MDIVVVTFNRPAYLLKCLTSILETADAYDRVIVVDNASTDTTPYVLAQLQASLSRPETLTVARQRLNLGVAGGRNAGYALTDPAAGEAVFFSDDDFFFRPGWKPICLEALVADPGLALVSAHDDQRHRQAYATRDLRPGLILKYRRTLNTAASLIRRTAFDAVGGYPESGKVMGYVSTPFCKALGKGGWKIAIVKAGYGLVENMDHPKSKHSLRDVYEQSGYGAFRRAAKRNRVEVGEDVRRYFRTNGP